MKGQPVLYSEF